MYREGEEKEEESGHQRPSTENVVPRARALCNGVDNPSFPSLPALARGNPSPDSSPTPHPPPTPHHCLVDGVCPQCRCTNLLVLGSYRKCPICSWKGLAEAPHPEVPPSASLPPEDVLSAAIGDVAPLRIGEVVWTLNKQGDITNKEPVQITAIELDSDGPEYAFFGWARRVAPLAMRASAPRPVSSTGRGCC